METAILITFIFGGIGLLMFLKRRWTFATLPPGPPGLPLVGNVLQPDLERPYILMAKWAEEYGDIYTMWNFNKPMVVCNGFEAIWEMLVSKSTDFAGRPQQYTVVYVNCNAKDVTTDEFTPAWVRRKKIFMAGLKMYGEGVKRLEDLMVDIIEELVEDMEATNGQPFDPQEYFQFALSNALNLLLLGNKFEQNDPDFLQLLEFLDETQLMFRQSAAAVAYDAFPWLHYLPLPRSKLMDEYVDKYMKGWIPRQIQKVTENYDSNKSYCVVEAVLEQQEQDRKTGAKYPISDNDLVALVRNYFGAGMSTSTSALYSLFAIMTAEPDIQAKAREEVDRVLNGRQPTLKDRESMPYFQALLDEVLRYINPLVLAPHKATKDSTLCGHFIPKGTEVLANSWFLFHDAKFWKDPYTINPERFLDKNGELLPNDHPNRKRLLTFGAGRRVCPGEALAKNRIFLITTSLLQKFIFKPAAEDQLPIYDTNTFRFGLIVIPQPYKLRAVRRD